MTTRSINFDLAYDRVDSRPYIPAARWIGRCKTCGATHQVTGELVSAHAPEQKWTKGSRAGGTRAASTDYVVKTADGTLYTMSLNGTDMTKLPVQCGDHWAYLQRVTEGTKKSKHECGARCTNATGPNCDCKCRGKNHGSNC